MNLYSRLAQVRTPVRVGLIGAGKFGSMFLAQARRIPGLHVLAIADLALEQTRKSLERVGWRPEQFAAASFAQALATGGTALTEDAEALIAQAPVDIVIEATGDAGAGVRHAWQSLEHGRHMIMVNVEADALAGPLLARKAAKAGVLYSLAYGDQPALIAELVDWARMCGFDVVAAGKGTKYLPHYHQSTPDTVWDYYGVTAEAAAKGGMNPRMFNSFLDGTKSAIEMAAVANATGLTPAPEGLSFPPCGVHDLPRILRPRAQGGVLHHKGQVEVISSQERDGRPVDGDLRWGVFVVFEAPSESAARCFSEYGLITDPSGALSALYRPYHLIGLELGITVASVALRGEPTGAPTGWRGDVVAVPKRDLNPGECLDGEGGYTIWGRLMPAAQSLASSALPIGLSNGAKLKRAVKAGEVLRWADVEVIGSALAVRLRREMEALFRPEVLAAAE